ncbi:hypothetical protein M3688_24710 [Brevibacillus borstelensis]|nr:hypothetical protein [Brevibacillus borstelensis]MCM3473481.1 hypothetical protein [Brevibacillus borstelensis]
MLTDITYMYYGNDQCAYLSVVKDGATKQILAHYLSSSLELSLVKRTLKRLFHRLDGNIHPEAILHSDQGMHYTHLKFAGSTDDTCPTHQKQLNAFQRAETIFRQTGKTVFDFDMGEVIGEGYLRGGGNVINTTKVQAVFKGGKLVTLYPKLR